jgi:Kelch motif
MSNGPFQPGVWNSLPSNCTSSYSLTFYRCAQWGLVAMQYCHDWSITTINKCIQWGWQQTENCSWWSWFFCVLFAIITTFVCLAFGIVVIIVCAVLVTIELLVCLLWSAVSVVFCLSKANGGTSFLLTDGTVMTQESIAADLYFFGVPRVSWSSNRWWKLTPDAFGSYANGAWSRLADSNLARTAYASAVLADGRVVVCGGEYSAEDPFKKVEMDWNNTCEIYDPVANTWTMFASPTTPAPKSAIWAHIGDAPCALLPDGTFLLGSIADSNLAKLDPTTLSWTAMDPRPGGLTSDEESWVLMPDKTIVTPSCEAPPSTWTYHFAASPPQWVKSTLQTSVVAPASDGDAGEIGPGLLRYDGTAFFLGGNEHSAIYSASANPQWSNGPDLPDQTVSGQSFKIGIQDGPGAVMVNGNILFGAGMRIADSETSPSWFFEYDGAVFNRTSDPPNNDTYTYATCLLLLPDGDILFCRDDDSSFYVYHSEAAIPQDSFRPVIQTCPSTLTAGSTIQISGMQFNGLSQAVGYGDDLANATNYPLVRIVNNQTNHVRYCRTFNHTTVDSNGNTIPSMGVAMGAAIVTTNVDIPNDLDLGSSSLFVVANGIPSQPFAVTVSAELF